MEDWIGTLLVILMIPGLVLLVAVVIAAMIRLKGRPRVADSSTELVNNPAARDADLKTGEIIVQE